MAPGYGETNIWVQYCMILTNIFTFEEENQPIFMTKCIILWLWKKKKKKKKNFFGQEAIYGRSDVDNQTTFFLASFRNTTCFQQQTRGALNFFSGRGVRPGFPKCGACELTFAAEKGGLVSWKFPNLGACELKISKFGACELNLGENWGCWG